MTPTFPRTLQFILFAATLSIAISVKSQKPAQPSQDHPFNGLYKGKTTDRIAYPIGGMGAGMFCIEGTGKISNMSVRHVPDVFNEPVIFAAISVKGYPQMTRVLEGPIQTWKKFGMHNAAKGASSQNWGLTRFKSSTFLARFPFAEIRLEDPSLPLKASINAWSPFIPTDPDNSSLPVGALEYTFKNTSKQEMQYVFSYNAQNFMSSTDEYGNPGSNNKIVPFPHGFLLSQQMGINTPEQQGDFAIYTDDPDSTVVDHCWFRGGFFDPITMVWNHLQSAECKAVAPAESNAPGATLYIPFSLKPGQEKKIKVMMAWFVPNTNLRLSGQPTFDGDLGDSDKSIPKYYKPWYAKKFHSINEVTDYWTSEYNNLYKNSALFRDAFYKSTLPPQVLEAIAANLTILKSPTAMRQSDGRFWGWEGCGDNWGSCSGSCTHVWNYAQALCHLFPSMERTLRDTEFNEDQDSTGHQNFRAALPIRPLAHIFYAAADGQLGGLMKLYREWRISGDSAWLRQLYPKAKISLDYCIRTWDPRHHGAIEEPHHNTYDIEFWGPDPMCTSIYLGALQAFIKMGQFLHEDVTAYQELENKGRSMLEKDLYNGEYYFQKIQWTGLNANDPMEEAKKSFGGTYSREARELLQKEGPKYQYGAGCLSDGVFGAWMAQVCGLKPPTDTAQINSHLRSVYRYNFRNSLSEHSNPQRSTYALGDEGGLLLCSWPKGGQLSLPFGYSNEVWTGIEYQVASHLIFTGRLKEGLQIVSACRKRYDGSVRNPYDEYECGHWYARAMSSYALIESLTGVRYDAVEKTLYVHSRIGNFKSFLSTNTGFGNVNLVNGKVTVETVYGIIPVEKIVMN